MRRFGFVVIAVVAAFSFTPGAVAGPGLGAVTGVVFHDLDRDGVRDEGEPGLRGRVVALVEAGAHIDYGSTSADGTYTIDQVAAGDYTLDLNPDDFGKHCLLEVTFDPLSAGFCADFALPWSSTSNAPEPVIVEADSLTIVDFGARPEDVAVVTGVAILEDDRAPPGTVIEALVDGEVCGTATVKESSRVETNFLIHVAGAGEQTGCATEGDPIQYRVGGVAAGGSAAWHAYMTLEGSAQMQIQHAVAAENNAWYWFERAGRDNRVTGFVVEALIDDVACGETVVQAGRSGNDAVGFSRLIVPSEMIDAGCGRMDALVWIRVEDIRSVQPLRWEPGLHQLELELSGDIDCDLMATSIDASLALQLHAGLVATLECQAGADADGDGARNAIDAAIILQFSAGLIGQLPP